MRHRKYDFRTAFIDLLINVLTGLVFLFMITTLLIQAKIKPEDQGVKKDAQFTIQIVWPNGINCDVDLWVKDPDNTIVNYQQKDLGIMHIERDDRGWINDGMGQNDKAPLANSETWVLRGKHKGRYTANIHLYSCVVQDAAGTYRGLDVGAPADVPVTIELVKLNPTFERVVTKEIKLTKVWQEVTAFNFTLDADNNVVSVTEFYVHMVREQK